MNIQHFVCNRDLSLMNLRRAFGEVNKKQSENFCHPGNFPLLSKKWVLLPADRIQVELPFLSFPRLQNQSQ